MCALKQLRHETVSRTLWVDALSINQADDDEKSQQVKAMARIFGLASRVLAWLGEEDDYVDLAFDTLEEICRATKTKVGQHCAGKLDLPISTVSENDVMSVLDRECQQRRSTPGCLFWPLSHEEVGSFVDTLSQMEPNESQAAENADNADLDELEVAGALAQRLLVVGTKFSEDVEFFDRLYALAQCFAYRAYWRRLWIVQELLCATDAVFICGKRQVNAAVFTTVRIALFLSRENRNAGSDFLPALDYLSISELKYVLIKAMDFGGQIMRGLKSNKISLGHAIEDYTWLNCSEPRDNIYSLLNISQPIDITIDYNVPLEDLFIRTTREIIRQENDLDIWIRKPSYDQPEGPAAHTNLLMPSWVPRYDLRLTTGGLVAMDKVFGLDIYHAGSAIDTQSLLEDPVVLNVWGYFLGEVKETHLEYGVELLENEETIWKLVSNLRTSLNIDIDDDEKRPDKKDDKKTKRLWKKLVRPVRKNKGEESEEKLSQKQRRYLFWRTLVMDAYQSPAGRRARISKDTALEAQFENDLETALSSRPPNNLLRRLHSALEEMRFCLLGEGGMALVHGDARVGDLVFVVRGASVPVVMRRGGGGKGKGEVESFEGVRKARRVVGEFSFVGGAYVNGVMDGEAIKEAEGKGDGGCIMRLV